MLMNDEKINNKLKKQQQQKLSLHHHHCHGLCNIMKETS